MSRRLMAFGVATLMALGLVGCVPAIQQQDAPTQEEQPQSSDGNDSSDDSIDTGGTVTDGAGSIEGAIDASQTSDTSPVPLGQWARLAVYSTEDDAYHDVYVRVTSVVTQSDDPDAIDAAIAENNELGYDFQQIDLAAAELPDDVDACLLTYEVSIPEDFPASENELHDPSLMFGESNIGGGGIPALDGTTYIGLGSNNTTLLTAKNNSDTVFEPGNTYEFVDLFTMVTGYEDYVFDVTSYPDGTTDTSADVMYTAYFASK